MGSRYIVVPGCYRNHGHYTPLLGFVQEGLVGVMLTTRGIRGKTEIIIMIKIDILIQQVSGYRQRIETRITLRKVRIREKR